MIDVPKFNLAAALNQLLPVESLRIVPEVDFKPFDLSELRNLPGASERAAVTKPNAAGRAVVYPPAVPFNFPNA